MEINPKVFDSSKFRAVGYSTPAAAKQLAQLVVKALVESDDNSAAARYVRESVTYGVQKHLARMDPRQLSEAAAAGTAKYFRGSDTSTTMSAKPSDTCTICSTVLQPKALFCPTCGVPVPGAESKVADAHVIAESLATLTPAQVTTVVASQADRYFKTS